MRMAVLALVLATKTLCRIQKAPVVTWLTMSQCTVRMVALAPRTSLDPPGFFSFSNFSVTMALGQPYPLYQIVVPPMKPGVTYYRLAQPSQPHRIKHT